MGVSDAVIISRPCNNTSAEPIDSQVTAPRLWDHGQSVGFLPACFFADDRRQERSSSGRL